MSGFTGPRRDGDQTGRAYPLPGFGELGEGDPQFTRSLIVELVVLMAAHDFPYPEPGAEYEELERALRRFVYSDQRP